MEKETTPKTTGLGGMLGEAGSFVKEGVVNSLKGLNEIENQIVTVARNTASDALKATGAVADGGERAGVGFNPEWPEGWEFTASPCSEKWPGPAGPGRAGRGWRAAAPADGRYRCRCRCHSGSKSSDRSGQYSC